MGLRRMGPCSLGVFVLALVSACTWVWADGSRYAMTHSRSQFVHWVFLYDANGTRIDPTDPAAPPYSPRRTCGRCHDYDAVAQGHHFNATDVNALAGRPGEPWVWTDNRTGTQLPLSYRNWPGTYRPGDAGVAPWDLLLKFGRHMPGGGPGEIAGPKSEEPSDPDGQDANAGGAEKSDAGTKIAATESRGRWPLSGQLEIDCMFCHSGTRVYSPEVWWEQVSRQNFAWAPTAALGLADVEGAVSNLPEDFQPPAAAPKSDAGAADAAPGDPAEPAEPAPAAGPGLPRTHYRPLQMNAEQRVFLDIVLKPANDVCYYCHTTRVVGDKESPAWTHDEDVHLKAGMLCVDCHRNDIGHHTVRGYEGEQHPTGLDVGTLSCRGCHMDQVKESQQFLGGRLGAPKPLHRGLPPLHLDRLSCTACHSGPAPSKEALRLQTAMAHGLGLPSTEYTAEMRPGIVAPVMLRSDSDRVLYPHRMVWPAFWGFLKGDQITPIPVESVYDATRGTLRVRKESFADTLSKVQLKAEDKAQVLGAERADAADAELTDEEKAKLAAFEQSKKVEAFQAKLGAALGDIKKKLHQEGAEPVYVAGGRVYRLAAAAAGTAADAKNGQADKSDPAEKSGGSVVEVFHHQAAEPYAWKLAHDVRPARWSSGATGCFECHAPGTNIFDGTVTAVGPGLDPDPPMERMAELAGYDRTQIDAWNVSFQGRTAFKWFGFVSTGIVGLVLLSFVLLGVNGLFRFLRRV